MYWRRGRRAVAHIVAGLGAECGPCLGSVCAHMRWCLVLVCAVSVGMGTTGGNLSGSACIHTCAEERLGIFAKEGPVMVPCGDTAPSVLPVYTKEWSISIAAAAVGRA